MGTELSLAGKYRGKLVELLHHSDIELGDDRQEPKLRQILDDDYIRSIPLHTDLLMTFMGFDSVVTQSIVQVRGLLHTVTPNAWSASLVMDVYGTYRFFSEAVGGDTYGEELRCTRVIEYKLLDILDAPLFLNWYWLSSSMKEKLFCS
jgi:hypothetical protein